MLGHQSSLRVEQLYKNMIILNHRRICLPKKSHVQFPRYVCPGVKLTPFFRLAAFYYVAKQIYRVAQSSINAIGDLIF